MANPPLANHYNGMTLSINIVVFVQLTFKPLPIDNPKLKRPDSGLEKFLQKENMPININSEDTFLSSKVKQT